MPRTTALVIGAGQAGLAMSRCLGDRGIDHVVIDRGRVAERWRSERWSSLRLLTPNWMTRLPGFSYDGPDPDGYMSATDVVAFLDRYGTSFGAPVIDGTAVTAVHHDGRGFEVRTTADTWRARVVIVATGYCDVPYVPPIAAGLAQDVVQLDSTRYRDPAQLPEGGVLVVGASATGVQLADEIHSATRPVTLAVGQHIRLPRHYRGRDILWWLDVMGVLDERVSDVYDIRISRRQPSLQLVGRPDHRSLDLASLAARGVRIAGHLLSVDQHRARFDDDLMATTAASDTKLASLLVRIDQFVARSGLDGIVGPPQPFEPHWPMFVEAPLAVDLRDEHIRSVLWATGFVRRYPWLCVQALDASGEIVHDGGITPVPGLYVIGLNFLRRRKSSFIDGVGADARDLAEHIGTHLEGSGLKAQGSGRRRPFLPAGSGLSAPGSGPLRASAWARASAFGLQASGRTCD